MMRAGTSAFMQCFQKTVNRFDIAVYTLLPCIFSFFKTQNSFTEILLAQAEYIEKIKPLPQDAPFSASHLARLKLALLLHTLRDAHFEVLQFSQVTEKI